MLASTGFGGEVKVWTKVDEEEEGKGGHWKELGRLPVEGKTGEVWAISLGGDGRYLATISYDGRICVWDLAAGPGNWVKAREYETKGSFGCCVAMVCSHSSTSTLPNRQKEEKKTVCLDLSA